MGEIILSCLIANLITLVVLALIVIITGSILIKKYTDRVAETINDVQNKAKKMDEIFSDITDTVDEITSDMKDRFNSILVKFEDVKLSVDKIKEFIDKFNK